MPSTPQELFGRMRALLERGLTLSTRRPLEYLLWRVHTFYPTHYREQWVPYLEVRYAHLLDVYAAHVLECEAGRACHMFCDRIRELPGRLYSFVPHPLRLEEDFDEPLVVMVRLRRDCTHGAICRTSRHRKRTFRVRLHNCAGRANLRLLESDHGQMLERARLHLEPWRRFPGLEAPLKQLLGYYAATSPRARLARTRLEQALRKEICALDHQLETFRASPAPGALGSRLERLGQRRERMRQRVVILERQREILGAPHLEELGRAWRAMHTERIESPGPGGHPPLRLPNLSERPGAG